jgi:hypothetical protein
MKSPRWLRTRMKSRRESSRRRAPRRSRGRGSDPYKRPEFAEITRVEAYRRLFTDVSSQRERQIKLAANTESGLTRPSQGWPDWGRQSRQSRSNCRHFGTKCPERCRIGVLRRFPHLFWPYPQRPGASVCDVVANLVYEVRQELLYGLLEAFTVAHQTVRVPSW